MTHVIIVPHSSSLLWQATMITSPDTQFSNVIPSQLQRSPPSSSQLLLWAVMRRALGRADKCCDLRKADLDNHSCTQLMAETSRQFGKDTLWL